MDRTSTKYTFQVNPSLAPNKLWPQVVNFDGGIDGAFPTVDALSSPGRAQLVEHG